MPYIVRERREALTTEGSTIETAGELNYLFTCIAKTYIETKGLSYQTLNDVIGALEGAKLELYRKVVAPYENQKCFENGEVY